MLLAELRKKRPKSKQTTKNKNEQHYHHWMKFLQRQKTELEQGGYRPKAEEEDISSTTR